MGAFIRFGLGGASRVSILVATIALAAGGCYESLDMTSLGCRKDHDRNCPTGYECRAPAGSLEGTCCKYSDMTCGMAIDGGTNTEAGPPGGFDASDGQTRLEAGIDSNIGRLDVGRVDAVVDAGPQGGVDGNPDVPLGGASGTGGTAGHPGGTGGRTGTAGSAGTQGQGGGGRTAATGGIGPTAGVQSQGGAGGKGTGGTTSTTGGAPGTGGNGTGGGPGTGGSGTGGTSVTGTGGTPVPATMLITSGENNYWQVGTLTESPSAVADVSINENTIYQTWEGFGGTFNELGWSYLTTQAMRDKATQLLFGNDGCRLAWGRIPMGATDYAVDRYTCDDVANDTTMAEFSIARDQQRLIPYIKAAQAVKGDLRFWASPWTPPTWMKTTNSFDGGSMKSDATVLTAYAKYFVKFVEAYAQQAITVEYVAPQNDPNYPQSYPSCQWDEATFTTFIGSYLGPGLVAAGLSTKIMLGALSNPTPDTSIASTVLGNATARGYCKIIGVQWGMADASPLATLKSSAPTMPIWLTQHKCGNTPWASGYVEPAPNNHAYAQESWGYIRDAIENGVTAYSAWNMVLDKMGKGIDTSREWSQNALLVADSGQVMPTPAYFVIRHFSQFVEPGAQVIAAVGGDAVAFKNPDGSLVAVMYNNGSANSGYVVSIGGKKLQFAMPASGWATIKR